MSILKTKGYFDKQHGSNNEQFGLKASSYNLSGFFGEAKHVHKLIYDELVAINFAVSETTEALLENALHHAVSVSYVKSIMRSAIKQDYVMIEARAAGNVSREEIGDNEIYYRQLTELPLAGYLSFIHRIANVTHNRTKEEFADQHAVEHFEQNILPMPPSEDAREIYDLLSIVGPTASVYDDIELYETRAQNMLKAAMRQAFNDCSIDV